MEDDLEDRNSVYQNVSFINEYSVGHFDEIAPSTTGFSNLST